MALLRNVQVILLIQICFSLIAFSIAQSTFNCNPSVDCSDGQIGDLVPDPEDCHSFYLCIDSDGSSVPSDNPLTCKSGTYFDQNTTSCVPETGICNNECNRICQTVCQNSLDLIPQPANCSYYYICTGSSPFTLTLTNCPPTLPYFDGDECTDSLYDCCDSCVPFCDNAATQVQDPYDCTKYYLCTEEGVSPDEQYHFTCKTGSFNTITGVCDPLIDPTTCNSYCTPATKSHRLAKPGQ